MIYGNPYEFAVFYEILEKTDEGHWKYGLFNFFIEDEAYPSKGSNYTLGMALGYLKDSQEDIHLNGNVEKDLSENITDLITQLAHSHGLLLDTDSIGFELSDSEPLGVLLSPLEILDAGFYLFYYSKHGEDKEYLVYTLDYGKTVKKTVFKKGIVNDVIALLPCEESI
ncbi:immunity protein 42 of polymorphic toxin system [Enterobacter sp. BIGb0383]|uniref:immunity 42 family protein n=1 Tax=unclassified Enterobacter TaxID=2608935 RepID=UPI000F464CAB|nr:MULTISPECIES: immunity 42 family protein [unclassified Enterobacter]ROP60164.1 immunity protein 42 of polymorphic toxin system [Enterobacter sp. BIGb0383]ROS08370.1 immunity protein 42 of polymorphic toxin system [Enterobacter sp. BIGb0359]